MKQQPSVLENLAKFLRLVLLEICWQLELTYRYLFTSNASRSLEFDKSLSAFIKSKGIGNAKIHQILSNSTLTILTPTKTMYRTTYRKLSHPITKEEENMLRCVCGKGSTLGYQNNRRLKINKDTRNSFKVKRKPRRYSSDFSFTELNKKQIPTKSTVWIDTR